MIQKTIVEQQELFPIHDVRVIDGDTIEARIILPLDTSKKQRIRLKGWWADELEGAWNDQGIRSKIALENFCSGKALWIHARGHRLDKYGRLVAHLVYENKPVNPRDVLGALQLTMEEHKAHSDANRASLSRRRAIAAQEWAGPCGGLKPDDLPSDQSQQT